MENINLLTEYPEIAAEWDFRKNNKRPEEYAPHSSKKVWWVCDKGHSYECTIYHRTGRSQGCPYCHGKKTLVGYNDLKTLAPELAAEWDYEKNGELLPEHVSLHSNKLVSWKCPNVGISGMRKLKAVHTVEAVLSVLQNNG